MDRSPPGSSVHGTLQAGILESVAISFSRGSSRPRELTSPGLQADSLPLSFLGGPLPTPPSFSHFKDARCRVLATPVWSGVGGWREPGCPRAQGEAHPLLASTLSSLHNSFCSDLSSRCRGPRGSTRRGLGSPLKHCRGPGTCGEREPFLLPQL